MDDIEQDVHLGALPADTEVTSVVVIYEITSKLGQAVCLRTSGGHALTLGLIEGARQACLTDDDED